TAPPPPFPPANTPDQEKLYRDWAAQNTPDILEPLFYATIPNQGQQWTKPGQQKVDQTTFDPLQYLTGPIPSKFAPTSDEYKQIMAARQGEMKRKAEEKAKSRPAPTPRSPRGPAPDALEGGGRGTNYAPAPVPTPIPLRPRGTNYTGEEG